MNHVGGYLRAVSIAAIALAASTAAAQACTCMLQSSEAALADVSLIIEGEVTAIEGGNNGLSNVATVTVVKAISGASAATIMVAARGPCGIWFHQGERLTLALENRAGSYTTNLCLMNALQQRPPLGSGD